MDFHRLRWLTTLPDGSFFKNHRFHGEKGKGQATRAMSLALLDEENERPRGVFTKQI